MRRAHEATYTLKPTAHTPSPADSPTSVLELASPSAHAPLAGSCAPAPAAPPAPASALALASESAAPASVSTPDRRVSPPPPNRTPQDRADGERLRTDGKPMVTRW